MAVSVVGVSVVGVSVVSYGGRRGRLGERPGAAFLLVAAPGPYP
ncbi:MAG: hypothetical protein WKF73_21345 [Nocardioidaceae bacterium]